MTGMLDAGPIEAEWQDFSATVLARLPLTPDTLGLIRRAFYAGAASSWRLYVEIGNPTFEVEAGERRLDALEAEFDQYARDLEAGRV
jgi:hypothetical protein